jgi:hypothetical protein
MNTELHELAYGSYEPCQGCGIFNLASSSDWDCVCDLLLEAGNCPQCMNVPRYCTCARIDLVYSVRANNNIMQREYADADMRVTSSLDVCPQGYVDVVHRYRTVRQRVDDPIAYTPPAPALTAEECANFWNDCPPSLRYRMAYPCTSAESFWHDCPPSPRYRMDKPCTSAESFWHDCPPSPRYDN